MLSARFLSSDLPACIHLNTPKSLSLSLSSRSLHLAFGRLATEDEAVGSFLARLGLSELAAVFADHDISLDTIELLTDDDLHDIGFLSIAVKRKMRRCEEAMRD